MYIYICMYIVHFNYSSRWGFRIAIGGKLSLDTRCWIHKSERGAKGGRELESKKHLYTAIWLLWWQSLSVPVPSIKMKIEPDIRFSIHQTTRWSDRKHFWRGWTGTVDFWWFLSILRRFSVGQGQRNDKATTYDPGLRHGVLAGDWLNQLSHFWSSVCDQMGLR